MLQLTASEIEETLDLNDELIQHPAATFFVRVKGTSMQDANIFPGDVLVIDRALEPKHKSIVVAIYNGEFTVKRLLLKKDRVWLAPENRGFPPIEIKKEDDFSIWGVVSYVIHKAS